MRFFCFSFYNSTSTLISAESCYSLTIPDSSVLLTLFLHSQQPLFPQFRTFPPLSQFVNRLKSSFSTVNLLPAQNTATIVTFPDTPPSLTRHLYQQASNESLLATSNIRTYRVLQQSFKLSSPSFHPNHTLTMSLTPQTDSCSCQFTFNFHRFSTLTTSSVKAQ